MLFVEHDENQFDLGLKELSRRKGIPFLPVTNNQQAADVRNLVLYEPRGMIRVDYKYSRGYDIKLTNDSVVVIVANNDKLKLKEV